MFKLAVEVYGPQVRCHVFPHVKQFIIQEKRKIMSIAPAVIIMLIFSLYYLFYNRLHIIIYIQAFTLIWRKIKIGSKILNNPWNNAFHLNLPEIFNMVCSLIAKKKVANKVYHSGKKSMFCPQISANSRQLKTNQL